MVKYSLCYDKNTDFYLLVTYATVTYYRSCAVKILPRWCQSTH